MQQAGFTDSRMLLASGHCFGGLLPLKEYAVFTVHSSIDCCRGIRGSRIFRMNNNLPIVARLWLSGIFLTSNPNLMQLKSGVFFIVWYFQILLFT
jgi:hypothetical protein